MIDPSEHIGLLHYVIAHLNIPAHLADEALSEGYVALTKAARDFKADKKVPEGAWIRKYIQWELTTWQQREYKHNTGEIPEAYPTPDLSVLASVEDRIMLKEAVIAVEQLTDQERIALIGEEVHNWTRIRTSQLLHMFGPDVDRLKAQARAKLANIIHTQRIQRGIIAPKETTIMAPKTAAAPVAAKTPAKPERVWCTGKTKAGDDCTMPVIIGKTACFNHMPQKYRDEHPRVRHEKVEKTAKSNGNSATIDLAKTEILDLDEDGNEVVEGEDEEDEEDVEEPVKATPPRRAAPAAPAPARTVARASNAAPLPTKAKVRSK